MGRTQVFAAVFLLAALSAHAVSAQTSIAELHAVRVMVPPVLDGRLDDPAWSDGPLPTGTWKSYNPLRGEPEQQRTRVWVAYDDHALYFAFRCEDAEPGKIRSTISRRDTVWNDDWVGVSLDSSRAGQVAYHMFVNPSGIQMDALQTSNEDTAPDWTWQSAGRIDEQGYVVEMRVPLQSIRFKSGNEVRMGVLFFRRNSRMGISWSWPEMPPGKWVFESHVPLVFEQLKQPLLLEVIPSATMSTGETRTVGGPWPDAVSKGDLGASVKYGVTSTITLDATVNPDFSQVESDAFQVEVNQRFPTFFSEKRPFFMEGMGLFELAGSGGDATMITAVHTRRIVEPSVGLKLTGTAGRQTFALLAAGDQSPPGDPQKAFAIGRFLRNFGQGQYVGALITDTEYLGSHNRVAAGDFVVRTGDHLQYSGALIVTQSRNVPGDDTDGVGGNLSYRYNSRRLGIEGQVEHYDRGFQMDTAFMNRVGVTRGWQYGEVQFYPDPKRYAWLKRIAPFVWGVVARDRIQGGTDPFFIQGIRFNFTRQGNLRLDIGQGRETFAGQHFDISRRHIDGNVQILRWLNLSGLLEQGAGIFYDPLNPFGGANLRRNIGIVLQPSSRLNHNIDYTYVRFEHEDTRAKVFDVHILNLRNTYQFTPHFLVRAITQWDSSRRRVLGDFLASYELVPGTVVHAGYGVLLESAAVRPYEATARTFFFKASYLARF